MINKLPIAVLLGVTLLFISSFTQKENNIKLKITGIKTKKGSIRIGIFKDDKSFQDEKAFKEMKFLKTKMSNESLLVTFALEPGTYGISLLDDTNDNAQMDYNFIGIPKEGFGFANYYHSGFSKPSFDDFKFDLKKDVKLNMTSKFRYM